jgi:hypothetical protein
MFSLQQGAPGGPQPTSTQPPAPPTAAAPPMPPKLLVQRQKPPWQLQDISPLGPPKPQPEPS